MGLFIKCPNCDIKVDVEDTENDVHLCPNCGYEWSTDDDYDDEYNEVDFGDTIFDINLDFEDQ